MTIDQDRRVDGADGADVSDAGTDDDLSDKDRPPRRWRRVSKRWIPANIRWPRAGGYWIRRRLTRWRLIVLTVAVVAAVGLAGGLFFFQYRLDQQTDDAAAHAAVSAASEGAVAVLSYSPGSVDRDLAVAQDHLTGEFLRYYRDFGRVFVAPAVRRQDVKASATVLRAAVSELHPDSAVVLLFIHQTSTSKDKPEPELTSGSVRATLTKVNRSWLISKFEPV